MTAPDRIWIDAWGGNWSPRSGGTQELEYVRRDPAVLAALPEVRALVEAALAAMTQECGLYLALWAVRHAEMQGLADGELHPQHYDRMAELGCRMDAFTRAKIDSKDRKEGAP